VSIAAADASDMLNWMFNCVFHDFLVALSANLANLDRASHVDHMMRLMVV